MPDENPSSLGMFEFPLRFPGQYADKETNLYYNYFRDYDPYLGRYAESDPIGLRGGLNTYGYVAGSPLSSIDPRGEVGLVMAGAAAGSAILPGPGTVIGAVGGLVLSYLLYDACLANSAAVPPDRINRCKEAFKWCLGDGSIPEAKCFEAYSSCVKTNNPFIFPGYGVVK